MPDLHGWISRKIDLTEQRAQQASAWGAAWYYDDGVHEIRDYGNGNTIARAYLAEYANHIVGQDPAAVLRRCAADRKILAVHSYAGGVFEPYACSGCGSDDMGHHVEHANDCETLLALAEGYGLNDDQRAQLDRPEEERPAPGARPAWDTFGRSLDEFLRPTTPTSDVPAALRGPNWKARP